MAEDVEVMGADDEESPGDHPLITEPAKLMRIAVMLREVRDEARRASTDEAGRDRLREVHEKALAELSQLLSPELQDELGKFTFGFDEGTPSESELLIAQAQLMGWLEGLFQGIQAAVFNQQAAAQKQLQMMRQRGQLPPSAGEPPSGTYL